MQADPNASALALLEAASYNGRGMGALAIAFDLGNRHGHGANLRRTCAGFGLKPLYWQHRDAKLDPAAGIVPKQAATHPATHARQTRPRPTIASAARITAATKTGKIQADWCQLVPGVIRWAQKKTPPKRSQ